MARKIDPNYGVLFVTKVEEGKYVHPKAPKYDGRIILPNNETIYLVGWDVKNKPDLISLSGKITRYDANKEKTIVESTSGLLGKRRDVTSGRNSPYEVNLTIDGKEYNLSVWTTKRAGLPKGYSMSLNGFKVVEVEVTKPIDVAPIEVIEVDVQDLVVPEVRVEAPIIEDGGNFEDEEPINKNPDIKPDDLTEKAINAFKSLLSEGRNPSELLRLMIIAGNSEKMGVK